MYKFWIFYARVIDGSMTPTKGPSWYPFVVLGLVANIYDDSQI